MLGRQVVCWGGRQCAGAAGSVVCTKLVLVATNKNMNKRYNLMQVIHFKGL